MSLNLEPNQIVGYRIRPDYYSFNVVVVKRHGPSSKHAGQEYDTPVSYCKTITHAATVIFMHALRLESSKLQEDIEAATGSVADMKALQAAVAPALQAVERAAAELTQRVAALELSRPELVRAINEHQEA